MSEARELLIEIAQCPDMLACLSGMGIEHPCSKIVHSQLTSPERFHVPEPWSGNIATAPILVIGSNPSIGESEQYPTRLWPSDETEDFFTNRFSPSCKWIRNYLYPLQSDGSYGDHWVRYWAAIARLASDIIGTKCVLGQDVALTEIVHCKSRRELGVREAYKRCASRYLDRILELSPATILITLGSFAAQSIRECFKSEDVSSALSVVTLGGRTRFVLFMPHPNARKKRKLDVILDREQIEKIHAALIKSDKSNLAQV